MIRVTRRNDLYEVEVTPPHSTEPWVTTAPLSEAEVTAQLERLGCHPKDAWDAVSEANLVGVGGYGFDSPVAHFERLSDFLFRHDYAELGRRAASNAEKLRRGDLAGARDLIEWSRAYTDVYFSPVNGNAVDEESGYRLTEECRALYARAFDEATDLVGEDEPPD